MTYREITGDLFEGDHPALGHGCNLMGVMGAGIADIFRRKWPEMYKAYRNVCEEGSFELGTVFAWGENPVIYCLGTQSLPGPNASLQAIRESVTAALKDCEARSIPELAIPRVGAGIGGLVWEDVRQVLLETSAVSVTDLVVVTLPEQEAWHAA